MKILVDLTPIFQRRITGLEIYGIELYKALLCTKHEVYPVFRVSNTLDDNPNAIILPYKSRFFVENFMLTHIIRKYDPDIALFPIFPPPLNCYSFRTKIIPTIHDISFLKYSSTMSWKARLYLIPKYQKSLVFSNKLITISNSVYLELQEYTNLKIFNFGNNISNSYILDNYHFDRTILYKYNINPGSYMISVSTIEPRKNMKYLLCIWNKLIQIRPQLKLVLTGRIGWGNDLELMNLYNKVKDNVIFTGYVEFDELVNLYHYSRSFILLSKYEGFGRTPLEALACGSKVIVSDIPVFHENLSNNNVCYIPLDDLNHAIIMILQYIDNSIIHKPNTIGFFNTIQDNIIDKVEFLFK